MTQSLQISDLRISLWMLINFKQFYGTAASLLPVTFKHLALIYVYLCESIFKIVCVYVCCACVCVCILLENQWPINNKNWTRSLSMLLLLLLSLVFY